MAHLKRSLYAVPAVGLSLVLGLSSCPISAFAATSAELQTQLDAASKRLNELSSAAEQAGNDLATVTSDLEDTKSQITQTEAEIEEEQQQLEQNQSELGSLVATQYKTGGSSIISMLLNSGSFSSLISSVHYADKAAEYQQSVISTTRELKESLENKKSELEEQKTKQEQLVSEQSKKSAAASAAASEAQSYYDQLSDELKAKIAEEQEAARKKAEEEAAAQAALIAEQTKKAEQNANRGSSSNSNSGSNSNSDSNSNSGSNSNSNSGSNSNSSSNSGSSSRQPTTSAAAMVQRAYSVIGSGYSYTGYNWTGSTSSSWFTCSGLIDYALGLSPWSNSPATLYNKVGSRITHSVSNLQYGDLVFFNAGSGIYHVGIYIGGGKMIDSIPNGGVGIRSVTYIAGSDYREFAGGGPIL